MIQLSKIKTVSFIRHIDWPLLVSAVALTLVGLVMIYSATIRSGRPLEFLGKQSFAFLVGLTFFVFVVSMNYQILADLSYYLYSMGIILLGAVLVVGEKIRGTRGWFDLGIFYFQPVEIVKLFFIFVLARCLTLNWKNIHKLDKLAPPLAFTLVYVALILLQPDFSSAIVFFPVLISMLYFAGANVVHILYIVLFGAISAGIPLFATYLKFRHSAFISSSFGAYLFKATHDIDKALFIILIITAVILITWWFVHKLRFKLSFAVAAGLIFIVVAGTFSSFVVSRSLKEYQRKRLIVFVAPEIDPLGAGYNIAQSKIGIGSGRVFGRGLFLGSQVGLGFIPEQHTDFIFSAVGEELGFIGSAAFIGLYCFFLSRIFLIIRDSKDKIGSLLASGICSMFSFYFLINVGMNLGLAPVTGLPLPFVSYGGSSLVSAWLAIGVLESIHARRFTYH